MAAAAIAARNNRRKRGQSGEQVSAEREKAAMEQQLFWAEVKRSNEIKMLFNKYDVDKNHRLDYDELMALMTELAKGQAPTQEEHSFVVTEAHKSVGNPHGKDASKSINKKELTMAIKVWNNYLSNKKQIEDHFGKYDTNNSGKLELEQLRALLTELNAGIPPNDAEVHSIMEEADGTAGQKTGGVNKTELMGAISLWYSYVEEAEEEARRNACCRVM